MFGILPSLPFSRSKWSKECEGKVHPRGRPSLLLSIAWGRRWWNGRVWPRNKDLVTFVYEWFVGFAESAVVLLDCSLTIVSKHLSSGEFEGAPQNVNTSTRKIKALHNFIGDASSKWAPPVILLIFVHWFACEEGRSTLIGAVLHYVDSYAYQLLQGKFHTQGNSISSCSPLHKVRSQWYT